MVYACFVSLLSRIRNCFLCHDRVCILTTAFHNATNSATLTGNLCHGYVHCPLAYIPEYLHWIFSRLLVLFWMISAKLRVSKLFFFKETEKHHRYTNRGRTKWSLIRVAFNKVHLSLKLSSGVWEFLSVLMLQASPDIGGFRSSCFSNRKQLNSEALERASVAIINVWATNTRIYLGNRETKCALEIPIVWHWHWWVSSLIIGDSSRVMTHKADLIIASNMEESSLAASSDNRPC